MPAAVGPVSDADRRPVGVGDRQQDGRFFLLGLGPQLLVDGSGTAASAAFFSASLRFCFFV